MEITHTDNTAVLVVGGSLVGLSAAVFLAWRGVPVVLVERHESSAVHPRAIGYTTRTLELFRAVGITLPSTPHDGRPPRRVRAETLAGVWHEEYPWSPPAERPDLEYSPVQATAIAQDRLEPILRARAVELGADLRLGTELAGFSQDDGGVAATLRRRADGAHQQIRARYMIAADGATSPIREALGIGRSGHGLLAVQRSILFRAPLEAYLQRGVVQFDITQPDLSAFLTTYSDGRWVLMLPDDRDLGQDEQRRLIRQAVGEPELPIDLITTGRWELAALIADRFSRGRIFLVGDAAHQLPPNRGGYGANTGIEDVHNLAWKLAAVLAGTSMTDLLDTYDAERRPIAWLRHDQIFARADYKAHLTGPATDTPVIDDVAMELGHLYRSEALPLDGNTLPPAYRPDQWHGQPGTRAPHLPVTASGDERSTLDLFQRGWVLLTQDPAWQTGARQAANDVGVDIAVGLVGRDIIVEPPADFTTAYGIDCDGASLIRPDGYIAWRSINAPTNHATALTTALRTAAMATPTLESRLRRLEDQMEIAALTARYGDAVDRGYGNRRLDLDALSEIYAPDATFYGIDEPPVHGIDAILAAIPEATAPVTFAMHAFLNPAITLAGDTAGATWLLWIASVHEGRPGTAHLGADFTYTKTPTGWRIQTIRLHNGIRLPPLNTAGASAQFTQPSTASSSVTSGTD